MQTGSRLSEEPGESFLFSTASPAMDKVRSNIERVAPFNVPVLLLGESGVGKKVAASWIHRLSDRAHRSFLKVNCSTLPRELLESELFGYEAGAFTEALRPKPGLFELCNHGTMLLDEIDEMTLASQAKLLRVLQDGQFSRLGGRTLIETDVRILAASNADVHCAMAKKTLREDLYYRLSAMSIQLPPLRERLEDIPLFLSYFMERLSAQLGQAPRSFSTRALDACKRYAWPGNVRELENFVKRYLILGDEDLAPVELEVSQGQGVPLSAEKNAPPNSLTELKPLVRGIKPEAEKESILYALRQSNWRRAEAARRLKMSRRSFYSKLQEYGIPKQRHDTSPSSFNHRKY